MATRGDFQGGIHLPYNKELAKDEPITEISMPEEIIIPLSQHIGAPCEPLVEVGDEVKAGQKIGESSEFVSAPVHASLSGTVKAIEPRPNASGDSVESIVIEVAQEQESISYEQERSIDEVSEEEIVEAAREAGIVGMGGASFPTSVKLSPPDDKPIDTVLINACECEPYLTCDHRMMLEQGEELIAGVKLLMKAVGAEKCYIGIEDNKPDAIKNLKGLADDSRIKIQSVPTQYPQGSEKHLITTVLGKEVPSGALPFEVGALVQNVATAIALYEAVAFGKPSLERVVTVTGQNIKQPANLLVKIGTPVQHIVDECGGFIENKTKVVVGGPMTGNAQSDLNVPITKGSSGIIALPEKMVKGNDDYISCMKCGACVENCPMRLYPNKISTLVEENDYDETENYYPLDCVECGICSYVCPARRPVVQQIKKAKGEIAAKKH
ncbi:electron transport complex subunit RsxC [Natroniella sulfidigena]|uniref:electron transport complex subunit RsxC n=1 Tax=Natroniella sulfidigena TaxID=723921 RepID=UPI00200B2EDF|nr:electron transport complex subunit RsxC [Natroniella sulfidigena]MCK8816155.1 electron transport complex subunit RsxC [Natroniella sulfidigena]